MGKVEKPRRERRVKVRDETKKEKEGNMEGRKFTFLATPLIAADVFRSPFLSAITNRSDVLQDI